MIGDTETVSFGIEEVPRSGSEAIGYLENDFSKDYIRNLTMPTHNRDFEWYKRQSSLQNKFVRAVLDIQNNSNQDLGQNAKRLVSVVKKVSDESKLDSTAFAGPYSILTFSHLVQQMTNGEYPNDLEIYSSTPTEDATSKVDLYVQYTDNNGKRRIQLIQLKSEKDGGWPQVDVMKVDREARYGSVSSLDARKMLNLRDRVRFQNRDVAVDCYVVIVPSFDSRSVGNVFGRINDSNIEDLSGQFRDACMKSGLLQNVV